LALSCALVTLFREEMIITFFFLWISCYLYHPAVDHTAYHSTFFILETKKGFLPLMFVCGRLDITATKNPIRFMALGSIPYVLNKGDFWQRTVVSAAVNNVREGDRVMDIFVERERWIFDMASVYHKENFRFQLVLLPC